MDYEVTIYLREGFNSFEVKFFGGQLNYFNCILLVLNLRLFSKYWNFKIPSTGTQAIANTVNVNFICRLHSAEETIKNAPNIKYCDEDRNYQQPIIKMWSSRRYSVLHTLWGCQNRLLRDVQ